jgi:two-component system chemotaxis response regulator CheY
MNFLLVDDSAIIRKMVKIALKKVFKGEILEAGDGLEALNVLSMNTVELIICDINMPNMDGMEFLSRVKSTEEFKEIPVIMLSTEQGEEDVKEAKERGAADYLKKPVKPEKLIKTVYEVIKKAY